MTDRQEQEMMTMTNRLIDLGIRYICAYWSRFGASRLLLPVNVCCANIAFFGDFFIFRFTCEGVRFPDRSKGLLRTYYWSTMFITGSRVTHEDGVPASDSETYMRLAWCNPQYVNRKCVLLFSITFSCISAKTRNAKLQPNLEIDNNTRTHL